MKKLHFSIVINAPVEKVWNVMLDDKTYREWAGTFMPESYFVGSWGKGSKIQFIGPDENGKLSGMTSVIADNKKYEFVSIHHLGVILDGVEDTTSPAAKEWNGFENYTFIKKNDQTELLIDVDSNDEYANYFSEFWPKALQKLKELAEQN